MSRPYSTISDVGCVAAATNLKSASRCPKLLPQRWRTAVAKAASRAQAEAGCGGRGELPRCLGGALA